MMMFVSRKRESMPGRRSAASFLHHVYGVLVMGQFGHLLVGQRSGQRRYGAVRRVQRGTSRPDDNFAVLDPESHLIPRANTQQLADRSWNGDLTLWADAAECLFGITFLHGYNLCL